MTRRRAVSPWGLFSRFGWAALAAAWAAGCARAPVPPQYQPYESVVQILADFVAHRSDDIYRFGYPRDVAGQNLFRATVARIDRYRALYPGRFDDSLAILKGQALERLGDYAGAIEAYGSLARNAPQEMRALAESSLACLRELAETAHDPGEQSSLPAFLQHLADKSQRLNQLAERFQDGPYASLARMEAEQADVQRALLLFSSRYVLPGGLAEPLREMAALAQRHSDSRLASRHRVMLGDFYFEAAKDYAALHDPEQLSFDDKECQALIAGAKDAYFAIAQKDGAPERLEARGKMLALEAFERRIQELRK